MGLFDMALRVADVLTDLGDEDMIKEFTKQREGLA